MTGTARIRWEDDPSRGKTLGWAGTFGRAVFSIWPPDEEGDRILQAYLAGEAGHLYHDDSEDGLDALKAKAEGLLEEFVTSLGAVFPDPCRECGRAIRPCPCGIWWCTGWIHVDNRDSGGSHFCYLGDREKIAAPAPSAPGGAGEKE